MKNYSSLKKKIITSICLLLGVVVLLIGGTLAIYTSQDHQRSVVRNRENETIRFSSDKLFRVTEGTDPSKYYCPMGQNDRVIRFYVCNYDQAKTTLFCEKDIKYNIDFSVSGGTGDDYIISKVKTNEQKIIANGGSCSFTDTLTGGNKSLNSYSFEFKEGDYNKVQLKVTVTPVNMELTQNRILNGILIPIEYASTQGLQLHKEFTDSDRETPDKFDAYNMLVSVSGGQGDVEIGRAHV